MHKTISALILTLALLLPAGASAQTATTTVTPTDTPTATFTATPTPLSQVICEGNGPCAQATLNPTDVAAVYAAQSVTPTPTIGPSLVGANAAAGSGAPAPSLTRPYSDFHFANVSLGTGSAPTTGVQATATFPIPFLYIGSYPPIVRLQSQTEAAAACLPYYTYTANTLSIGCAAAPAENLPVGSLLFEIEVR